MYAEGSSLQSQNYFQYHVGSSGHTQGVSTKGISTFLPDSHILQEIVLIYKSTTEAFAEVQNSLLTRPDSCSFSIYFNLSRSDVAYILLNHTTSSDAPISLFSCNRHLA